jgi:ATP-dependent Lon protease
VENNFNFMELGPKGTGKSHVFQDFSPYGVLVSGGDVTSARLFVKMSGRQEILGLVGYWDNVAWDEFEQQKGRATDAVLIDTMQNYLANKAFNRGGATHEASASMCFVGNTKHTVEFMMRKTHLFESIPTSFIKGAFLDRIHLYNPGWEISPLKKSSFSGGYGMITDYFAAILHSMRKEDRSGDMLNLVKFSGTLSERDHLAIRKTFSGMMKLLYPDGAYTEGEAMEVVNFAAEGRKRVKEQLYKIDETFKAEPAMFEYEIRSNGEKRQIKTLEELGRTEVLVEDGNLVAEITQASVGKTENEAAAEPKDSVTVNKPVAELGPKHIHVVANQRGVSFRSLFGDYLKGAHKIVVVDPFIMKPYQIDNLIDLMQLVLDMNATSEEDLRIELHTKIDEMKPQEQNAALESLREELATEGVEFEFTFDATHDRGIFVDDKWAISLGRGLDIYDWFDRHSLKRSSQRMRKCKDFQVTIAQIHQKGATNAS